MANTYTQIHIQVVFVVKYRKAMIHSSWENLLYKYITGIVKNNGHKMLAINGMPDHLHIFIGLRPVQSLSSLMKDVKGESSEWINKKRFLPVRFQWQPGYAAFSYGKSGVSNVIRYIQNQKNHHKKKPFRKEYLEFLEKFEIDYDKRYLFKTPE